MRMGWGPRGSEQAGRASRLLPVKCALGLDAAFVPGMKGDFSLILHFEIFSIQ